VLADGLNPLRNYGSLNPNLICTYDFLLRQSQWAEQFRPDRVIQLGELPTNRTLRAWLEETQPDRWIIAPQIENFDPLHGSTVHLRCSIEEFTDFIRQDLNQEITDRTLDRTYTKSWCEAERQVQAEIDLAMNQIEHLCEPKITWLLSQVLPPKTSLFVANSTPVRDMEWFWKPGDRQIDVYFNRGVNGIDGTLSTALGIAHGQENTVLLTGDLALLHDTNGFLQRPYFRGHLTIILINNRGGGIFELLPIAQFDPPFEDYFATPQQVDFVSLCQTYGVAYEKIESWQQLQQSLNPLPNAGIRVLEICTDRKADAAWRLEHLVTLAMIT
jgi:2-succinyl-5-enolpyruvyl-6-hydroxy-3-cyclohexene-1-carboxylate synthase